MHQDDDECRRSCIAGHGTARTSWFISPSHQRVHWIERLKVGPPGFEPGSDGPQPPSMTKLTHGPYLIVLTRILQSDLYLIHRLNQVRDTIVSLKEPWPREPRIGYRSSVFYLSPVPGGMLLILSLIHI